MPDDKKPKPIEPQFSVSRIRKDIHDILDGLDGLADGTSIKISQPHINDLTRSIDWRVNYHVQLQTVVSPTQPRVHLSIDVEIAPYKDLT